ncbi:hypothetical protein Aperf_G00000059330 [Anoplocephala perfoliata]
MSAVTSSAQPADPSNTVNGLPSVRPQQAQQHSSSGGGEGSASGVNETSATASEEVRKGSMMPTEQVGGNSGAEKRAASDIPTATTGGSPSAAAAPPPAKRAWRDQPHVGKYKLIRTLGSGNFAKVKLAQHITTKKEVAVKVIDKGKLNHASLNKLFREVNVMKQLNHPNIVKLYEVIESDRHVYLVMEFVANGELFEYLASNGRMREKDARIKFRQIVSAVQYCHQKNIVHRDLKAENLLLDADFNIKLADFGFSNTFRSDKKLDTFCGSPPYAAPELFLGKKYIGPEVDVWSLGVILYTIVAGYLPFDAQNLRDLRERVLRGKYRIPFFMSTDCELLLKKMLVLNPEKRYSLLNVMADKWTNLGMDDNPLQPYQEPSPDYNDPVRLRKMEEMGFTLEEIRDSLENKKFNNVTATYFLLGTDRPTVSASSLTITSITDEDSRNVRSSTASAHQGSSTTATTAAAGEHFTEEAPNTSQVLVSSTSMRKGSLSTRANGSTASSTAQAPGEGGENSTSNSTFSTAATNGKQQKSSWSQKRGETVPADSTAGRTSSNAVHFDKPKISVGVAPTMTTTRFDAFSVKKDRSPGRSKPTSNNAGAANNAAVAAVRRTRTFTSADKRRNTAGTGGHGGAGDATGDNDSSKALVRAPNMDNIVNQVYEESVGDRDRGELSDEENLALDALVGVHSAPSRRSGSSTRNDEAGSSTDLRLAGPTLNQATTLPSQSSRDSDSTTNTLKRRDSLSTIAGDDDVADCHGNLSTSNNSRSSPCGENEETSQVAASPNGGGSAFFCGSMTRKHHRDSKKQQQGTIRFEAVDTVLPGSPPNTVPAFMRGAPDRSTAPAARIGRTGDRSGVAVLEPALEHSQRFRPISPLQLQNSAQVEAESPVRVTTKPTEYHSASSSSFLRSVSSRLTKSFRRKRSRSHSRATPTRRENDGTEEPHSERQTAIDESPLPAHQRAYSSERRYHPTATAAADDPWSPMLPEQGRLETDTLVTDLNNSLEPLLPACNDKKPRNISIFSSAWRKASASSHSSSHSASSSGNASATATGLFGSNPDRLMNQLIGALNVSRIHFARPGKYLIQFVLSPSSASGTSAASPALELAGGKVRQRVRAMAEVCHVFGTSSYVIRFKHLSHNNTPTSATEDFKAVTQSLIRLVRTVSVTPSTS